MKTTTRRFTDADILSTVRRESLIQWLTPAKRYLEERGIRLPSPLLAGSEPEGSAQARDEQHGGPPGTGGKESRPYRSGSTSPPAPLPVGRGEGSDGPSIEGIDYAKLAALFMEPDEAMPVYLVQSLFLIHEMADEGGMDRLLAAFAASGNPLGVSEDATPIDVAVQAYLADEFVLEDEHSRHRLVRRRAKDCFAARDRTQFTTEDAEGGLFRALVNYKEEKDQRLEEAANHRPPPTSEELRAIEARLNRWFEARGRGRGCRVLMWARRGEWCFLVRHGLPCKRENAIKDGETTSVFYRPLKQDVLTYDMVWRELEVHCCGRAELEELRRAFGTHLFGSKDHFQTNKKYRLNPLVEDGPQCLVCSDVRGIAHVSLRAVTFRFDGPRRQKRREVHRAGNDIYWLVAQGAMRWPEVGEIERATFEFRFTNSMKKRRVTVVPPNRVLTGSDEESLLVEQWLRARGFIAKAESYVTAVEMA